MKVSQVSGYRWARSQIPSAFPYPQGTKKLCTFSDPLYSVVNKVNYRDRSASHLETEDLGKEQRAA